MIIKLFNLKFHYNYRQWRPLETNDQIPSEELIVEGILLPFEFVGVGKTLEEAINAALRTAKKFSIDENHKEQMIFNILFNQSVNVEVNSLYLHKDNTNYLINNAYQYSAF